MPTGRLSAKALALLALSVPIASFAHGVVTPPMEEHFTCPSWEDAQARGSLNLPTREEREQMQEWVEDWTLPYHVVGSGKIAIYRGSTYKTGCIATYEWVAPPVLPATIREQMEEKPSVKPYAQWSIQRWERLAPRQEAGVVYPVFRVRSYAKRHGGITYSDVTIIGNEFSGIYEKSLSYAEVTPEIRFWIYEAAWDILTKPLEK